jgi:hypothetical protein
MVSPEHIDNQTSENQQAPSPAVKQQVPTEVEKKRPWLKPLMRVLGVVVPLIGGIAVMWLIIFASDVGNWLLPLPFILGIVGAVLLRSWWSILSVPGTSSLLS